MQISSHSPNSSRLRTMQSPPQRQKEPTPVAEEPVDTFQAASKEKSETSFLGFALLGLTAVTGFISGRATVPAAADTAAVVKETKCECPTVDIRKDSVSVKDDGGFQNPDDWKEELGGGPVHRESSRSRKKTKKSKPARQQKETTKDYDYPDSWKEEIGGGSYRSEREDSSSSQQSDDGWDNPDDWKSGL